MESPRIYWCQMVPATGRVLPKRRSSIFDFGFETFATGSQLLRRVPAYTPADTWPVNPFAPLHEWLDGCSSSMKYLAFRVHSRSRPFQEEVCRLAHAHHDFYGRYHTHF